MDARFNLVLVVTVNAFSALNAVLRLGGNSHLPRVVRSSMMHGIRQVFWHSRVEASDSD
jgi:hypothetical protein